MKSPALKALNLLKLKKSTTIHDIRPASDSSGMKQQPEAAGTAVADCARPDTEELGRSISEGTECGRRHRHSRRFSSSENADTYNRRRVHFDLDFAEDHSDDYEWSAEAARVRIGEAALKVIEAQQALSIISSRHSPSLDFSLKGAMEAREDMSDAAECYHDEFQKQLQADLEELRFFSAHFRGGGVHIATRSSSQSSLHKTQMRAQS